MVGMNRRVLRGLCYVLSDHMGSTSLLVNEAEMPIRNEPFHPYRSMWYL